MAMAKPRVILGWLAFVGLIAMSVKCLIRDGALTLEAWTYLMMTPLAMALALSPDSVWSKGDSEPVKLVDEDEGESEFVGTKDAPDPIEDGFDVPVL